LPNTFKFINGPDYVENSQGPLINSDVVFLHDHFPYYPVNYNQTKEYNYNKLKSNMLLENCCKLDKTIWIYDSYMCCESTKNSIFMPAFTMFHDFYDPQHIQPKRKYKFVTFNNKSRLHRIYCSAWIKKHFNQQEYFYTCRFNVEDEHITEHLHFIENPGPGLPFKELNTGKCGEIVSGDDFRNVFYEYSTDAVFQIVNENAFWEDACHISEKTAWAILSYNIPIVTGYKIAEKMEQVGFDMFTDIVDYSSQHERNPWIRTKKLLHDNLKVLKDAHNILNNKILYRLNKNYNLLTDPTIDKIALKKLNTPKMLEIYQDIMYNKNIRETLEATGNYFIELN